MPAQLPAGESVPPSGSLPASARRHAGVRGFGAYVHVPFCATRCGYCDFNTYTPAQLGNAGDPHDFVTALSTEIALAHRVLGGSEGATGPLDTIFVGGGTPTLLAGHQLGGIVATLRETFGLRPGAEITTEANPESVTPESLAQLRQAGFTRLSLGMQSTAPHVLAVLERQHTPGRPLRAVGWAREAGFDSVSLDLIYGTPGESDDDWRATVAAAIETGADHISAYGLIVEEGTKLARRVARGELPAPDDDVLADRYLMANEAFTAAGLEWYEISNWARSSDQHCRHNKLYWRGGDWWGFGPGAHSHVGGVRWWNVKHPSAYAQRLAAETSPAHAREMPDAAARRLEEIMLRLRLAEGLKLSYLDKRGLGSARAARDAGLLDSTAHAAGSAVLTLRGRLLADAVTRELTADL